MNSQNDSQIKTTEDLALEIARGKFKQLQMKVPETITDLIEQYATARKSRGLPRMNKQFIIFEAMQKGIPAMIEELPEIE